MIFVLHTFKSIFKRSGSIFAASIASLFVATVSAANATTVAYWNFNSTTPDTNGATGTFSPAFGQGTAEVINASFTFQASASGLDTSSADDSCVRMNGFPAASEENKTAGIEFRFSTVGHENLSLQYDHNNNSLGSRYYRMQYTADGTNWIDHQQITNAFAGWFIYTVDFRNVPAANNNPNFGVRIVSEFESTATGSGAAAYVASQPPSNYSSSGTFWVDRVTFIAQTNKIQPLTLRLAPNKTSVQISWSFTRDDLERTTNLFAQNWQRVTSIPNTENGFNTITLPLGETTQFFRLRRTTFRAMSYNIHHGEGTDGVLNLSRIANVILAESPDFVGLQEVDRNTTRTGNIDQMAELGRLTGMYYFFGKNKDQSGGDYGVGVLSRFPILSQQHVLYDKQDALLETRGVNVMQLNVGETNLYFFNTHLDHTTSDAERLYQIEQLKTLVQSYPADRVLIGGDLNFRPTGACYDSMKENFFDAWPRAGSGNGYSFPSPIPNRRIDFFWTGSLDLQPIRAWIAPSSPASDHLPLVMDFLLPGEN